MMNRKQKQIFIVAFGNCAFKYKSNSRKFTGIKTFILSKAGSPKVAFCNDTRWQKVGDSGSERQDECNSISRGNFCDISCP